jgi:hypothetical protein
LRLPFLTSGVFPDSEEWPDEPDDPDPESRWGQPEDDLTSIPSVEDPGERVDAEVEIDSDLARYFWVTVVYANVALGGVSIGLLVIAFRGQFTVGGVAIAVGLIALYRTYDLYDSYQTRVADDDATGADDAAAASADTAGEVSANGSE